MSLPEAETDPNESPMIPSDCTCCDTCAYCSGMDCQGEIDAVLHARACGWMRRRIAAGLPLDEDIYRHRYIDDPAIEAILERLRAR